MAGTVTRLSPHEFTEDERVLAARLRVAQQERIEDPYTVVRQAKPDWSREQWDQACQAFAQAQRDRWNSPGATS